MGSGHNESTRGVALVIHKRWTPFIRKFQAIHERIAYVDIIKRTLKIRITTAYFPHSGYADNHVQSIYDTLTCLRKEAKQHNMYFIVGADCNAKVGERCDDDDKRTMGQYAMPGTNARGLRLKRWAATRDMTSASAFCAKASRTHFHA